MKYVRSLLETFKKGTRIEFDMKVVIRILIKIWRVRKSCISLLWYMKRVRFLLVTCKNSITKGEDHTGNDKW